MAGRPKRDYEVKSYLVRLPPALIDRIEYCCSLLDVATRQRLPRNTHVQQALEEWCERVEAGQQTLAPTPGLPPASVPSVPKPSPSPVPAESQPLAPKEKKQTNSEDIERILSAREQYERLSLREFAQLLYDRNIYRATDRKTGEEKPINRGTLSRWLQQGGMT